MLGADSYEGILPIVVVSDPEVGSGLDTIRINTVVVEVGEVCKAFHG